MSTHFTPPAFIVGVGRSGTTLLASIINRHPLVYVTPETGFFYHVFNYPGGIGRFTSEWPNSFMTIAAKMNEAPDFNDQRIVEEVLSHFGSSCPPVSELFITLCNILSKQAGKALWVEKTPVHVQYLDQIRSIFPQAPIIHLVRDGRAVSESRSRMPYLEGKGQDYFNNLLAWVQAVRSAHTKLAKDPYAFELRYEDLVTSTEKSVQDICTFLGIEYYSHMLQPDGTEAGLIELKAGHKEGIKKPIDAALINRWENTLPTTTKFISKVLAGVELERWGYVLKPRANNEGICVYVTKDFFQNRCRSAILNILAQLGESGLPMKMAEFFTIADNSPKSLVIDTLPTLHVDVIDIGDLLIAKGDIVVMTTPEMPRVSNVSQGFLSIIRLARLLRRLCNRSAKIIWIFDGEFGQSQPSAWSFRRAIEKTIAKKANVIICNCGEPATCKARKLLAIKNKSILHLPGDSLMSSI